MLSHASKGPPLVNRARRRISRKLPSMAAEPKILELSNGKITARISNWGATITSLLVPDAQGPHRSLFSLFRLLWVTSWLLRFPGNPSCWLKSAQGVSLMWCSDSMAWIRTW